jgi:hypothetical protein
MKVAFHPSECWLQTASTIPAQAGIHPSFRRRPLSTRLSGAGRCPPVFPAQAGIQGHFGINLGPSLGSGFRRNDGMAQTSAD